MVPIVEVLLSFLVRTGVIDIAETIDIEPCYNEPYQPSILQYIYLMSFLCEGGSYHSHSVMPICCSIHT